MSYANELNREVDFLSRLLTSNPYTAEGKNILNGLNVNLTIEDFFEREIYATPFFLNEHDNKTNHTEDIDEEDSLDREDYIFVCDDQSIYINSMIREHDNFELSFNNLNELPLLFIRGGSGTGKSTYMYSLIYELTKTNSEVLHTEFTLETYSETDYYYGIRLPEAPDDTISKFIRIVFAKILSITAEEIKNKDIDKAAKIFDCYNKKFVQYVGENPINTAFFKVLSRIKNRNDIDSNMQKIVKQAIKFFDASSNKKILCNLLLLLVEICYCSNPSKFNLISFDGIEYLINRNHHIFDSDINEIISVFYDVKRRAEDLFSACNLKFASSFKIVLAIRNTTLNYYENREQEDIRDSNISVDVTEWYRTQEIFERRIKYFSEMNYIEKDDLKKIKDIVDIVINDVGKGKKRASGAMDMLERMYNFDKRSLQSNLLSAVSQIVLSAEGGILKDKFIIFYKEKGPLLYNRGVKGYRYRYLCRRAIIRILLNRIESQSKGTFFDGLYFSEQGDESMPSSYMRKMLIFLMHNQVENNRIKNEYVSFEAVINSVARPKPNSNITDSTIEEIARLIYRLGDFRPHDSAYQQLISIKFNCPNKQMFSNEGNFVARVKELYRQGCLGKENFGVKLNYAGAFFAYIQSDFEFFACRCKEFRIPLIFSNDTEYITSLMEEVYLKAVNCMKMVIQNEKDIFGDYKQMHTTEMKYLYKDDAYGKGGRLIPHPKRIINNHITYLEHYKYFVEEVDDIFSMNDKKIIIDKVNEVIGKYKRNYNELVEGYGSENGDFYGQMYLKDYNHIPYLWKSAKI